MNYKGLKTKTLLFRTMSVEPKSGMRVQHKYSVKDARQVRVREEGRSDGGREVFIHFIISKEEMAKRRRAVERLKMRNRA